MTRRMFIGSAFATGISAVANEGMAALSVHNLRFGIMSDMHITDRKSCEAVVRTLRFFRDRGVDAVVFAGDMIDNGLVGELELFAESWFSVFPNGRTPDGRKVEMLSVLGNHDLQRWTKGWADEIHMSWDRVINEDLDQGDRMAKTWQRLFGTPLESLWIKNIKGVKFVGSNYQYRLDRQRRVENPGEMSMPDFLNAHRSELTGEEPFFFIQHMHPKGTCSAPWAWGQDDGTATDILKTFPNAIALTGHSNTPINDERTLWRGEFTSVGTGAVGFLIPFGGRENSEIDGQEDSKVQLLPRLRPAEGKHAMICSVMSDCVTFERFDVQEGCEKLAADWVVPMPAKADSFANRARRSQVPNFASSARISVRSDVICNRKGERKSAQIAVFPNTCSPRAFDYEVQIEELEADVISVCRTKRVYSNGFYRAERFDAPMVECPFAKEDFPVKNRWRFAVRPCDCFGNKGGVINTEWFHA